MESAITRRAQEVSSIQSIYEREFCFVEEKKVGYCFVYLTVAGSLEDPRDPGRLRIEGLSHFNRIRSQNRAQMSCLIFDGLTF
jgi:hypothetical protein